MFRKKFGALQTGVFALLTLSGLTVAAAQTPVAATASSSPALTPAPAPTLTPDQVLEYEKTLALRSTHFENYLVSFYTVLGSVLTVGAASFGLFITFYNRRDVNAVKNEIATEYRQKISEGLENAKAAMTADYQKKVDEEMARAKENLKQTVDDIEAKTKRETDEAVKRAKEDFQQQFEVLNTEAAQRLFHEVVEYASVISHASALLSSGPVTDPQMKAKKYQDRADVIGRFQKLQDRVLQHRTFNILLGRLHREQGDFPAAIAALTKAIQCRDPEKLLDGEKTDYGALLYNRACYQNLLARQNREQGAVGLAETHAARAWDDLKVWVKLSPDERGELDGEKDLNDLVGVPPRTSWPLLWSETGAPAEIRTELKDTTGSQAQRTT